VVRHVVGIVAAGLHRLPDVVQAVVEDCLSHTSSPFEALRILVGKLVSELTAFQTRCTALSYPFLIIHQEAIHAT
jgi:hypothetical protein